MNNAYKWCWYAIKPIIPEPIIPFLERWIQEKMQEKLQKLQLDGKEINKSDMVLEESKFSYDEKMLNDLANCNNEQSLSKDHPRDVTLTIPEHEIKIPVLSIIPMPSLLVDKVDITFDMEVKQSNGAEDFASKDTEKHKISDE